MSIEAINWALKQTIDGSTAKFVLVVIANCANIDFVAYPSMAYIEEATCQDRKTVLKNIKKLRDLGYLIDTGERKGASGRVVVYKLDKDSPKNGTVKQYQKRDSPKNGIVPNFPRNSPKIGMIDSPKNGTEDSPKIGTRNISIEPSIEPSGNHQYLRDDVSTCDSERKNEVRGEKKAAPKLEKPNDVDDELWRDFLAHRKTKKAPVTQRVIDGIRKEAQKAGITLEDAIDVLMRRGWASFEAGWYTKDIKPPNQQIQRAGGFSRPKTSEEIIAERKARGNQLIQKEIKEVNCLEGEYDVIR